MVVREFKDVIRILVHPRIKQKMDVYLKRMDNYSSRMNDHTYGLLIVDAWERFKAKSQLSVEERAKYELIDVELPYSVFLEIREYANKKGLLEIVLDAYMKEVLNERSCETWVVPSENKIAEEA